MENCQKTASACDCRRFINVADWNFSHSSPASTAKKSLFANWIVARNGSTLFLSLVTRIDGWTPLSHPRSNCFSLPAPNVLKWKCLWLTFILLCFIRHVRLCFFVSILVLFEQRQNKGRSMNVNDTISEEKLIAILALRIKRWKRSHSAQQGCSSPEPSFPRKDCSEDVSSCYRISASHTQDSFKRYSWQLHLLPNSNDWERFWLGLAYLMPLFVSDIPLELPFRSFLVPGCSPPSRKFRLVARAKAPFVFEQHFKLFAKCVILPFCMHEQSFFVAFSSHFSQLWARLGVQYVARGR